MRTRITALACLAMALVPLAACDEQQQTETRAYDLTDKVDALAVSSLGGRITVTAGSGGTVHVTETIRYTGAKPVPQHNVVGSDLTFTSGCASHPGSCSVDYHLEVPATFKATLDSAGGTISVTGLSGELNLTSGGGAVDASGITPATITARTGGGAIQLTFTKPPESVRVDSSGGDVTLRLPRDRYSIDAQGSGGTTTVEIPTDAASAHRIGVHSGGGDILVTAPE
ncbi:DUF4097 family beta strand repeat-containing protein [Micromonospora sp. NPDC048169]|uniref:DUF4097 family beta strand repeat-containing protein n=1 Tax=Micromonospora sp. NPDC048169 TaxID=3154711 RepID=UPI0033C4F393